MDCQFDIRVQYNFSANSPKPPNLFTFDCMVFLMILMWPDLISKCVPVLILCFQSIYSLLELALGRPTCRISGNLCLCVGVHVCLDWNRTHDLLVQFLSKFVQVTGCHLLGCYLTDKSKTLIKVIFWLLCETSCPLLKAVHYYRHIVHIISKLCTKAIHKTFLTNWSLYISHVTCRHGLAIINAPIFYTKCTY